MIVYRPYLQTNLFHIFVGILAPVGFGSAFYFLLRGPAFHEKILLLLSFPCFVVAGIYYLFAHCVWKLTCDDERGLLYFTKTFRRIIFRVRDLKELNVYNTFRGVDYRFKTTLRQVTIEEMDGMPELVSYLRKANPQIDVTSPEDHTLF